MRMRNSGGVTNPIRWKVGKQGRNHGGRKPCEPVGHLESRTS